MTAWRAIRLAMYGCTPYNVNYVNRNGFYS